MADGAQGAPTPKKSKPAIVSEGSYRVDPRAIILRPPVEVKLAEPEPLPEPSSPDATVEIGEQETSRPSPEEVAREEAARIIEAAKVEAESLKTVASERGHAEGKREGIEQGKREGREEGLRELQGAIERWLAMGDSLAVAWRARYEGLREEIKSLAIVIAEKLLQDHLKVAPDSVVNVVKDALRHAAEADKVTVLVSAKDLAAVRSAKEELAGLLHGTERFEIVDSEKVEPGSCIVETKSQVIDASRRTRIDRLNDAIQG